MKVEVLIQLQNKYRSQRIKVKSVPLKDISVCAKLNELHLISV